MNNDKTQRIYLDPQNPKDIHIKVKLEQNTDTLEFLSMGINTQDAYQNFNADYGVLVGRVLANNGIGVPNARISIFIPLSDDDDNNGEIRSIYPYKSPRDKNSDNKRYNLLPRVSRINPQTGILSPKQPFGSFPIKEEIVTNPSYLTVYKKYYKYTALTNSSGDYMIFGVPIGTQIVHLSIDITDIGQYSMTPASMVKNLGYSPNLFTDDGSKIKSSDDLDDLPHIETQEIIVDVIPFWGDTNNFDIGITQQNFRVRATLVNTFIVFGSAFTDGDSSMWGESYFNDIELSELYRARSDGNRTTGILSKRIGIISEKIFYYPPEITDAQIASGINPTDNMVLLDSSEYSIYKRDGDFVFIINCNRDKIITNDLGVAVPIDNDSPNGVFTKFKGYFILELSVDDIPMNFTGTLGGNSVVRPMRYKFKFPQYAAKNQSFQKPNSNGTDSTVTLNWKKQHFTFEAGKYYSFSRFHGTTYNNSQDYQSDSNGFYNYTTINRPYHADPFWNIGTIITQTYGGYNNDDYEFPSNSINLYNLRCFGANWLNLSVYFPQIGFIDEEYSQTEYCRTPDNFTKQIPSDGNNNGYFVWDNTQEFITGIFNTKWFARSDLHWTDIIEIPITDIQEMNSFTKKGFKSTELQSLDGKYRNGSYVPSNWPTSYACPLSGGKINGDPSGSVDTKSYFYKGFGNANCINFLFDLGLVD